VRPKTESSSSYAFSNILLPILLLLLFILYTTRVDICIMCRSVLHVTGTALYSNECVYYYEIPDSRLPHRTIRSYGNVACEMEFLQLSDTRIFLLIVICSVTTSLRSAKSLYSENHQMVIKSIVNIFGTYYCVVRPLL